MLTINIVCIGKIKEKFFKDAIDEYSKRLSKYCKLNIVELPDEKIPEKINTNIENDIKSKECTNMINHIKKDSIYIYFLHFPSFLLISAFNSSISGSYKHFDLKNFI